MAYTLSDLVSKVQSRLNDTGYSSSKITAFLNSAQREVFNRHALRFMEATQSYNLVAGQADITNGSGLPTNYQVPINLRITTNGYEKTLNITNRAWIDQRYPDPTSLTDGTPAYAYEYAGTIYVLPEPDQAYTVVLRYLKTPTELDSDDDVPSLPGEFQEILILGATKRALETKDNYDQAAVLQLQINDMIEDLVVRYGTKQFGTPNIIPINRRGRNAKNSIF